MDEIRLNQWTLEQKEAESRKIIREAIEKYPEITKIVIN